jgi:hypothetical protein
MNRRRALALGGSVAGSLIAGTGRASAQSAAKQRLLLNGVTIVDTHDGTLSPNMAILIDGGKIVKIAPAQSIAAGNARTVNARGKFVVPGFNDYHAHPLSSSDPEGSLTLMLANGVTGFREMASQPETLVARANDTLMPWTDVPELLEIASTTLAGSNARTPEIAVAEVQKQKALGADFIKVIDTRPEVFFAALAESTRLKLRFMGHLSPSVNVRDAATAGMRSIEHMGPRDSILLGCSTDEAALRAIMAQAAPKPPPAGPPTLADIKRGLANPVVGTDPSDFVRFQRVIDTFSAARRDDLAAHFVAAGTWQVPTLIRVRTMEIGEDPIYRNDPNLRYVPQATVAMWEDVSKQFAASIPVSSRATLKNLYALQTTLVKPFHDAGVQMMAGSDLGGGFVVAGFGLHHEFDLLAQAGLSPLAVLQMTTLNGAKVLGREATMGSVAEGKNADLVLLDANPIASVANLHRISAVVRAGAYYSGDVLAAMKEQTATRVAAGLASAPNALPLCACCLA